MHLAPRNVYFFDTVGKPTGERDSYMDFVKEKFVFKFYRKKVPNTK